MHIAGFDKRLFMGLPDAVDNRRMTRIARGAMIELTAEIDDLHVWYSSEAKFLRLDQACLLQLPDTQRLIHAAHSLLAPPRRTLALDRKQVICRGRIAAMRERRCGGHADNGYRTIRPIDPYRRMNVTVAVQDQFHAVALQQRQQVGGIRQPLEARIRTQRMMDQQHAKNRLSGK